MTALKVIGIILLIFILIGFLRVGALMQFGDELRVQLSVGPFRFTLLPAKEKKETPKKKAKEEEAKVRGRRGEAKEKALAPQADKRGVQGPHHDGALGAQGDSETHLQAPSHRPLEILIVFGGTDPADIAQTYGYASAAMWGVMPHLEDLFHIPDPSLHLRMDYSSERRTQRVPLACRFASATGCTSRLRYSFRCSNGTCAIKRRIKTTLPRKNQRRALRKTVNTVKN